MPRQHYIWHDGDGREIDPLPPPPKRVTLISDTMPTPGTPAPNRRYDSKSRYYADTKAAGGEIVGNDFKASSPPKAKNPEPVHQTIERLNQQKGWGL